MQLPVQCAVYRSCMSGFDKILNSSLPFFGWACSRTCLPGTTFNAFNYHKLLKIFLYTCMFLKRGSWCDCMTKELRKDIFKHSCNWFIHKSFCLKDIYNSLSACEEKSLFWDRVFCTYFVCLSGRCSFCEGGGWGAGLSAYPLGR